MRSTRELALLSREVRAGLGRVSMSRARCSPRPSITSSRRPTSARLYAAIGSADKTFVELRDSYHLATMDNDKELVFARTLEFIAAHAGSALAPAVAESTSCILIQSAIASERRVSA